MNLLLIYLLLGHFIGDCSNFVCILHKQVPQVVLQTVDEVTLDDQTSQSNEAGGDKRSITKPPNSNPDLEAKKGKN